MSNGKKVIQPPPPQYNSSVNGSKWMEHKLSGYRPMGLDYFLLYLKIVIDWNIIFHE